LETADGEIAFHKEPSLKEQTEEKQVSKIRPFLIINLDNSVRTEGEASKRSGAIPRTSYTFQDNINQDIGNHVESREEKKRQKEEGGKRGERKQNSQK
jgi:hypothetical protein